MERLAAIPEVTDAGDETALAVIAPVIKPFAPPVNLLMLQPQGLPFGINPSSSVPQSHPVVTPIAPLISTQSGEGSTTFKEYMEQTIARMRAPHQEPPVEQSRTAMPTILVQTMSFGTVGGAPIGPSLEATATSAPIVL